MSRAGLAAVDVERRRKREASRHTALLQELDVILLEAARGKAHLGKWREPPSQRPVAVRRCAGSDAGCLPSAPRDQALGSMPDSGAASAAAARCEPGRPSSALAQAPGPARRAPVPARIASAATLRPHRQGPAPSGAPVYSSSRHGRPRSSDRFGHVESDGQSQGRRAPQGPSAAGRAEPRVLPKAKSHGADGLDTPWAEPPHQFSRFADRIERQRVHYPSRTFNAGVPRSVFSSSSAPAFGHGLCVPGRFGGPCRLR